MQSIEVIIWFMFLQVSTIVTWLVVYDGCSKVWMWI